MCSICGGGVCFGTNGCQIVAQTSKIIVQNPQNAVQIAYSYSQVFLGWINYFFASLFTIANDFVRDAKFLISSPLTKTH